MPHSEELAGRRHTLAHLLAAAVLRHYPHAKPTIGPAIENGFYYDFDFGDGPKPGADDLPRLTQTMRELLPQWTEWKRKEVNPDEAKAVFADNPYKLELIDELEREGVTITLYTCGGFTDLCRGGHAPRPAQDIDPQSFTLDRVAGAYWRGDENNPMLTRIYGLAFASASELQDFLAQREEAKKRDHRKIGKELDLFTFSELVGPGLPLWTPLGTTMRILLDQYVWQLRSRFGYQRVTIPHLTRKALYETSGHWEKFADELFKVISREEKEMALKPMNCPHHTQIFARRPHSYREMPQRFAETTMVYRDEQSGELGGLTRVLSITQDDSHVFCRVNQIQQEFFSIWDIVDTFYKTFGFVLRVRLSFHDPQHPEKYLGSEEVWARAESALREIAKERGADYFEAPGEAAMYGPKLDFMAKDSLGREHQVATIQLDFNLPERFNLTCVNEKGEEERVVMIHCAIMGSIERFSAVLLEHTAGHLPFWLAPEQVRVIPVSESELKDAQEAAAEFAREGIRASVSEPSSSLGKRVREAAASKIPIRAVIGKREVRDGTLTLTHAPTNTTTTLGRSEALEVFRSHNQLGASDIRLEPQA
ncbi:threonine--tRNA ligase [Candidatus Parcubacteria bacterium]|nr:MAG: threonine--tRNA ligase [Candidatus Parcubacteria bacterium]GIW69199.1 MAG: threonine--tRNA ligase [Candidatus Parcubacteria bacterium]